MQVLPKRLPNQIVCTSVPTMLDFPCCYSRFVPSFLLGRSNAFLTALALSSTLPLLLVERLAHALLSPKAIPGRYFRVAHFNLRLIYYRRTKRRRPVRNGGFGSYPRRR